MTPPAAHKHAFWLFGVLVGLAIKEAVTKASSVLFPQWNTEQGILELGRLVVFLTLSVRFYLGAGEYFSKVYEPPGPEKYLDANYALDFLCGFAHFMLFCFWSVSITEQNQLFFSLLQIILLFDLIWWWLSRNITTSTKIAKWAILNFVNVLANVAAGLVVFLPCLWYFTPGLQLSSREWAATEIVTYFPVMFFSAFDIGKMIRGRSFLEDRLAGVFNLRDDA